MDIKRVETDALEDPVDKELKQSDPVSVELQPIQSDWCRPHSITACRPEFKNTLLTQKRSEVYMPRSRSQRKGLALLITNITFDHLPYRNGAEKDEENMEWLLRALGYSVEKHTNLSGEAMIRVVNNFSNCKEHKDSDSTFVVIMSHGDRFDSKDAILGVQYDVMKKPDDFFFVEDIFSQLNSVNCPALIDKPKVILIQACRGGDKGGVDVSECALESDSCVHREKDFVCFMSSVPDTCAYRNSNNGSHFINHIVDMFSKGAYIYDIMELFRKIASRMVNDPHFKNREEKLLPCIERMTLVKKFYLFPGL